MVIKSPNKKQQTRQKIVESAAQLFTAHGFDKVSIDDIMHNAQLTRGGFYAHFSSKEALYSEAITSAASLSFAARIPAAELSDQERLLLLLKSYLSENHLSDTNPSCPLAFLATDVAHQNDEVRDAYTTVYKRLAIYIARLMAESPNSDRVLALSAMMIGGVAVARSLNDERTRVKLLTACEKTAQELIRKRDGKTTV
ncbi:TetR/AcrR family transcriptional regulator [Thiomicrorhabdus sp.]|uniref:TetR/AcrR family transcriptional regulator n=1 Tax=Thiomicrorhabdus sp. TaxID=2039724 RepID=UPI0029C77124|nr:TetR/AcrR family transcriptional regulator [Thiomicrorhabdus sp.]